MQELNYYTFRQKLDNQATLKAFPLRAMLELTYACNFNCLHCYIPPKRRKQQELTTKEIFLILDQLRKLGCLYLGFTGGEIFLRQDIWDIIWYAKKKGFLILLLTNGSLIDKKAAEELKKISPNKVDITLHSMKRINFENITRCKGSFVKVMRSIKLLHQRKVPLGIKNCLLQENKGDLEGVRKFAFKLGAISRMGAGVGRRIDGCSLPLKHFYQVESRVSLLKEIKNINFMNNRPLIRTKKRKCFACGAGTQSLTISPEGEIKICQTIDFPKTNILKVGLKKAWKLLNNSVNEIESKSVLECNSCKLVDYCTWCPEKSWLKCGSFTQCDEDSKLGAYQRLIRAGRKL